MYKLKTNNPAIYFQKQAIPKFELYTQIFERTLEKLEKKGKISDIHINTTMANGGYAIHIRFKTNDKLKKPLKEKLESLKNTIYLYPGPYFCDLVVNSNSTIKPVLNARYGNEPEYQIRLKKGYEGMDKAIEKFFQDLEDYINNF